MNQQPESVHPPGHDLTSRQTTGVNKKTTLTVNGRSLVHGSSVVKPDAEIHQAAFIESLFVKSLDRIFLLEYEVSQFLRMNIHSPP